MKNLFSVVILLFLCSCKEKKKVEKIEKNCFTNFTYSKANIRMSYRLKFNLSDSVYYIDRYPYGRKGLHYFLLENDERKILNELTCKLRFPEKDSLFFNSQVEDGTTIGFSIDSKRIMLHTGDGPKEFWKLEEWIDNLQTYKHLKPIERKVNIFEFDKMLKISPPPIIK